MNAEAAPLPATIEDVVVRGDLSKLTPEQKVEYYYHVCNSLGLNPATKPFDYVTLSGKQVLYLKRDGADQLRKLNGINLAIVSRTVHEGLLTVHVRATDKTGRTDEELGVVSIAGLRGEAAANAVMKAITKAKRRVTLSISGLGFPDENELPEQAYGEPVKLAPAMPQRSVSEQMRDNIAKAVEEVMGEDAAEAPAEPDQASRIAFDTTAGDSAKVWSEWAIALMKKVREADSVETINDITNANADSLVALANYDAEKHGKLKRMIDHQIAIRTEQK